MNLIKKTWLYFRRWYWSFLPLSFCITDDLPDKLEKRTLYAIGEDGAYWMAALNCPCGCGAAIQLSLIPNDNPKWALHVESSGKFTLHPSIHRVRDCRSHFFLRGGKVKWV